MRHSRVEWSKQDMEKAIAMRADGKELEDIAFALHRTESGVKGKLRDLGANTVASAQRLHREGLRDKGRVLVHLVTEAPPIAPAQAASRDQMYFELAQRNLTATLCGDPPQGRSALAQKTQRELQRQTLPTISAVSL